MSVLFPKTWWEKIVHGLRELWATFCVTVAVSLCSGCLNVRAHASGRVHRAFTGTVMNVEAMEICCKCGIEGCLVLIPLSVDLPLEVVADTVTLPFNL